MMREHDLAAMGFVGFGEPFSWREGLGVSLALAAVVVMQTGE
jgi:multidrug transporter EmrE-like cation transporter